MAKQIQSKIDNGYLTIQVEGKEMMMVNYTRFTDGVSLPEIGIHAILHGVKQKICDAAALPNGATLTEKYNAMREVYDRITSPDATWNKVGEGTTQPTGLLFKALCRKYTDKSPEVLRAWLDKQDKVKQAALRKNPEIAAIIETIKAESAKTGNVDTSSLLDELDAI